MNLKPRELGVQLGKPYSYVTKNVQRGNLIRVGQGTTSYIDTEDAHNKKWILKRFPDFYKNTKRINQPPKPATKKATTKIPGKQKKADQVKTKTELSSDIELKEWSIKLKKEQFIEKATKNKKLQGELVEVNDVISIIDSYILSYKQMLKLETTTLINMICSEQQAEQEDRTGYLQSLNETISSASDKAKEETLNALKNGTEE